MRRRSPRIAAWSAACFVAAAASADAAPPSPWLAARDAATAATQAAIDVVEDPFSASGALSRLDVAMSEVAEASLASVGARRSLEPLRRRLSAAASQLFETLPYAENVPRVVRALHRAARAGHRAARMLRTRADGFDVFEVGGGDGFHRRGSRIEFRLAGCGGAPVVVIGSASSSPLQRTFEPGVATLGRGRFRVTLGPDVGGARVTVTACGATRDWVLFDEGPPRALETALPEISIDVGLIQLRVGVAASLAAPPDSASSDSFDVAPPLPAGLALDAKTGAISGTPTTATPTAVYVLIGRNRRGAASAPLSIQVTPALPPEMVFLEDGFVAAPVATSLAVPVKMAFAPDGRLFFDELTTGSTRIIGADGTLAAQPFSTVPVLSDGDRGLLGVALAPDFATSGHVFVYAATPGDGTLPDRSRILRFTDAGGVGTDMTVIVDSLPVGPSQNGGVLKFGPDGKLYVTVGDTTNPSLAQLDGSRAGRILRFNADGSIPADNPIAGDPEWCRGLRNSFGLAFEPTTGGLFASENGPAADDELDYILPGKNYEWGAVPESIPGPQIGLKMVDWATVIVPTGITFLGKGAFGADYAANLFVAGYDQADVRRLALSGALLSDVDEELPFARWHNEGGVANKPLDALEGPDGSLYVSTFSAIWRISRY